VGAMIHVTHPNQIPAVAHYAVLIYKRLNIDCGYPGESSKYVAADHYVTTDREDWGHFVQETHEAMLQPNGPTYVAFEVPRIAKVTLNIEIGL
jgi:hypothetical protein